MPGGLAGAGAPPRHGRRRSVAYLAGVIWHRFHRRELRSAPPPAVPLEEGVAGLQAPPDDLVLQRETLRLTREAVRTRDAARSMQDALGSLGR